MLEIKHLSYQVEGESGEELGILNDVSLTVADHQFVVITGPNGGGKTTLAKAIMGLVRPTGGTIAWNGTDITGLDITQRAHRGVSFALSGGEVKRIEIATILARKSGLMIFDEPEAGIDLWSFAKLTETFKAIHQKREATLIVISHQERIIDLADEIVMIRDGKIAKHGPKDEIFPQILANTSAGCSYMSEGAR